MQAFVTDKSPDAFAKVVDRLLKSPHYGERWGRHWLDVARYGEDQAHTFKARRYPRGYRYRDWVVNALNNDMPYDRFLKTQIAGDLLEEKNQHENYAALGLFALGPGRIGYRKDGATATPAKTTAHQVFVTTKRAISSAASARNSKRNLAALRITISVNSSTV